MVISGGEEYMVEKILDSWLRRGKLQFKVKWKGYGTEEDSWESSDDVHTDALICDFYRLHPGAPRYIATVSFANLSCNWRSRDVAP